MTARSVNVFDPSFYLNDKYDLAIRNETVLRVELGIRARYAQRAEATNPLFAIKERLSGDEFLSKH